MFPQFNKRDRLWVINHIDSHFFLERFLTDLYLTFLIHYLVCVFKSSKFFFCEAVFACILGFSEVLPTFPKYAV